MRAPRQLYQRALDRRIYAARKARAASLPIISDEEFVRRMDVYISAHPAPPSAIGPRWDRNIEGCYGSN